MPLSLKDAIAKLYKPPSNGARQVIALGRSAAEKLPRLPTVAIISISEPGKAEAEVGGFPRILRLSFSDVNLESKDLSRRAAAKAQNSFTAAHAIQVHSFVVALPEAISTIVVNCEGGYSRSAAIALALHRKYGYEVEERWLTEANPSVLRVMLAR